MTHNRLDQRFDICRKENRPALILYATAGFPDMAATRRLLPALEEAGADVIELGIPFSDPIADGPTIQKASARALEAGASLNGALEALGGARADGLTIPTILFGAFNPFLRHGLELCARDAAAAGAEGFLAADLPLEEADEFQRAAAAHNLHFIYLAAPTTPEARLGEIARRATGFLYCIAIKGVTGARANMASNLDEYAARIRRCAAGRVPAALGFGISTPAQIRALRSSWDGLVVGSALIQAIEDARAAGGGCVEAAARLTRTLREAIDTN